MLSGVEYAPQDALSRVIKTATSQCSNDDMRCETAGPATKAVHAEPTRASDEAKSFSSNYKIIKYALKLP